MKKQFIFLAVISCGLFSGRAIAQNITEAKNTVKVGAYYYDGWSGLVPNNITPKLTDSFPERKSIWGWVTSDQKIMDQQINCAADYGLSFFCFDWYLPDTKQYTVRTNPLNRAVHFFMASPDNDRLEFSLLVCNTGGSIIRSGNWKECVDEWITILKHKKYLHVGGKPLISFISTQNLIKGLGSVEHVREALDSFRTACADAGLPGITIGAFMNPPVQEQMDSAQLLGFDVLSGYNYFGFGFKGVSKDQTEIPIEKLQETEITLWDRFKTSPIPYVPVVTLNWDPRPKDLSSFSAKRSYYYTKYYTGFSTNSVYNSVKDAIEWVRNNPGSATKEKLICLYAWNEYNEGAWLTPSDILKDGLLLGVKRAVLENAKK
jgi:hypothetical protein